MYNNKHWVDEILDVSLSVANATGTGSQTSFVIAANPLFLVKVTVAGTRVFNWYYNRATHTVVFDVAPANGAAIVFYYHAEVQRGTDLNAFNLNEIEYALQDEDFAINQLAFFCMQKQRVNEEHAALMDSEVLGELKEVTITNNQAYPFNSTMDVPVSVALTQVRSNLFYTVEVNIKNHVGEVGHVYITDKALNGFKVSFDGSGTSVTLELRIKGGIA